MPSRTTTLTAQNRTSTRNKSVPPPSSKTAAAAGKKRKAADASDSENDKPAPKRGKRAQSLAPPENALKKSRSALSIVARAPLNAIPAPASHPRPSRRLLIFGAGDMGQCGLGTEKLDEITRPRIHPWFEDAVEKGILGGEGAGVETAWAGGMHTLVVDEAGKVWSWGINDNAALGRPTVDVPDPEKEGAVIEQEVLETQPMVVQSLEKIGFRAVQVVAGDSISVALGEKGDLRAWGSFRSSDGLLGFRSDERASKTQFEPIPIPTLEKYQFVSVACGADHVMALTTTGHVWVWGNGQQAQLGRRVIERRKLNALVPERLALRKIVLIGTGMYHSFAQDATGVVYAWGLNTCRQTGIDSADGGDEGIIWQPTEVAALNPAKLGRGRRVVQISGGEHHSLFLLSDGSVLGCGRADDGQCGLAADHPIMLDISTRKAARSKALAADPDAKLDAVEEVVPTPTLIRFPPPPAAGDTNPALPPYSAQDEQAAEPANPIRHISAGTRHNLAVSRSGHAYSWGSGENSQLGLGPDVTTQPTPTRIVNRALDSGFKVELATAGGQHCVLLAVKPAESETNGTA